MSEASGAAARDVTASASGGVARAASSRPQLQWFVQQGSLGAAEDLDWAMDTLAEFRAVAAEHGTVDSRDLVRVYVPQPTLAFGQRDARLPGHAAAAEASQRHGFTPLTRRAGGRAAAYHPGCVVVDHVALAEDAALTQQARFEEFAGLFVRAFQRVDVDARIGEIPGEYCPGEFSVHAPVADGGRIKLAGSAQRVVKGAWLCSTHVVVEDSAPLRAVLTEVYEALGLPMDPATVGAAEDATPGVSVSSFVAALCAEYTDWAAERGRELTAV